MNNLSPPIVSPKTEIKTPWTKASWGKLQRFLLSVDSTGEVTIKQISKGILSFMSKQLCCLSPLPPFSPKTFRIIEKTDHPSENILARLNEEQRTLLFNWKKSAVVNRFPEIHARLDSINEKIDQMIALLQPYDHKRQCLEVLQEEIFEQKEEHLKNLQAAPSSLALQQAGYLFLERVQLMEELFELYRTES